MRIGYSFWGFLGPGIIDTPDGGRSHRRVLIEGLRGLGHDIVFLQTDRDRLEAGTSNTYIWDTGFPDIDVLFLEWRWPIPGRNTTICGLPGHTCDLHRQRELLEHYTHRLRVPTIVWDKDRQLPAADTLRGTRHVSVCEAALHPSDGATSLLFPVADDVIDSADPAALAQCPRPTVLAYVGNQYDRDDAFDTYFAPAATGVKHVVAGKWTDTSRWPWVSFIGRVGFSDVQQIHRGALATMMLLPERYAAVGQMTQRLPEAVLAGCLPLMPASIRSAPEFSPRLLHVANGAHASSKLAFLARMAGTDTHIELIAGCVSRLGQFRLTRQLEVLDTVITRRSSSRMSR